MDTVHSFNVSDLCLDELCKKALCEIQDFTNGFEVYFEKCKTYATLPPKIFVQLESMVNVMAVALLKLKRAYIYSKYSTDADYVSRVNSIIKKLTFFKRNLKLCSKKTLTNSGFNLLYSTKNYFYKLQGLSTNALNTVRMIVDTSQTHFTFAKDYWPKSDVLIGSLRNSKQLSAALKHDFYHIPKSLVKNSCDIKCIAIYQSQNLFDKDYGIKYYGKVLSFSEVARHKIKEIPSDSDEIYVKFEIEKWRTLKSPIRADYMGDACLFTTLFQFMQCEKSSELTINNKEEFELYMFMKKNAFTANVTCFSFWGKDIVYNGEAFEVIKDEKTILKITNERFIKNSVSALKTITAHIKPKLDLNDLLCYN